MSDREGLERGRLKGQPQARCALNDPARKRIGKRHQATRGFYPEGKVVIGGVRAASAGSEVKGAAGYGHGPSSPIAMGHCAIRPHRYCRAIAAPQVGQTRVMQGTPL
jgi:hypothetical protein